MPVDSVSVVTQRASPYFPNSSPGADVPIQRHIEGSTPYERELTSSPERTKPSPPAIKFPLRKRYQELFYRQEQSDKRPEDEEQDLRDVGRESPVRTGSSGPVGIDVKTENVEFCDGRSDSRYSPYERARCERYESFHKDLNSKQENSDLRINDSYDRSHHASPRFYNESHIIDRNFIREGNSIHDQTRPRYSNERTYINGGIRSGSAWPSNRDHLPRHLSPYGGSTQTRTNDQLRMPINITPPNVNEKNYLNHFQSTPPTPPLYSRYQRELKFETGSLDEDRMSSIDYGDTGSYARDNGSYIRDNESYGRDNGSYVRDNGSYARDSGSYGRDVESSSSHSSEPVTESNRYSLPAGGYEGKMYDTTPLAAMLQRFSIPPPNLSGGIPFPGVPDSRISSSRALPFAASQVINRSPQRPSSLSSNGLVGQSWSPARRMEGGDISEDIVTKRNQFYCHICTFVGTTDSEFTEHMKCHFEHQCPYCTYSSRTEGRLKRHISDFHSDKLDNGQLSQDQLDDQQQRKVASGKPKLLKCRQCKFITTIREEFWAHSRIHIKKEKQLSCPRCEFVTEFKHHLEYHIRNHVGSKPYKCNKCTYTCVNKSMLNSHMKSHTNIYRYRCASCSYATKYAHSLKIHLHKKNHNAAVVLNEDGSLPADGLGNFDLLSKRGPPKGIKASKKVPLSLVEPSINPLPEQGQLPSFPQYLNGFSDADKSKWFGKRDLADTLLPFGNIFPNGSNALMQSQNDDDSNGFNIRQPLPFGVFNQLENANLSIFSSKFSPTEQTEASSSKLSTSAQARGPFSMPCYICDRLCGSAAELSIHIVKKHSDESRRLLESYGIQPDMISSLTWPSPSMKNELKEFKERCRIISPLLSKYFKLNGQDEDEDGSIALKNFDRETGKVALDSPPQIPSPEEQLYQSSQPPAGDKPKESSPLDLSSRQLMEEVFLRKGIIRDEDEESSDHVSSISEASSPMSGLANNQATRKRSRKGKACKLDVQHLTMQPGSWDEDDEVEKTECADNSNNSPESSEERNLSNDANKCTPPFTNNISQRSSPDREYSKEASDKTNADKEDDSSAEECSSPVFKVQSSPQPALESSTADGDQKNLKDDSATDTEKAPESELSVELDNSVKMETSDDTEEECLVSEGTSSPQKVSESGFYMCPHCEMGFRDRITHSIHMGYHGFRDPFRCNMCGHRSSDRVEFFIHMARVAHM